MNVYSQATKKAFSIILLIPVLTVMTGCSNESRSDTAPSSEIASLDADLSQNLPIPKNHNTTEYRVLLFGNSHVAGLDRILEQLIANSDSSPNVVAHTYGGGFLDNAQSEAKRDIELQRGNWTHIILQGQKYSQSGTVTYPTKDAQRWIAKAKQLGITPILFPEHPQKNNRQEGRYIHQLHETIATLQSTCLAPIGLTWDRIIEAHPEIKLHSDDGNHASKLGMELTALVFYSVITGKSLGSLATQNNLDASSAQQAIFKDNAAATLADHPPCQN